MNSTLVSNPVPVGSTIDSRRVKGLETGARDAIC